MDQGCEVSAVIKDQIEMLAVLEGKELLFQAPIIFLLCLAFPRKALLKISVKLKTWSNIHTPEHLQQQ